MLVKKTKVVGRRKRINDLVYELHKAKEDFFQAEETIDRIHAQLQDEGIVIVYAKRLECHHLNGGTNTYYLDVKCPHCKITDQSRPNKGLVTCYYCKKTFFIFPYEVIRHRYQHSEEPLKFEDFPINNVQ